MKHGRRDPERRDPERRDLGRRVEWPLWAAQVVRALQPRAHAVGGFASRHLLVRLDARLHRPAVAVVLGARPASGVLERAPEVVIEPAVACSDPEMYLAAGTAAVCLVRSDEVLVHSRGVPRSCRPPEALAVPGVADLRLPAALLTAHLPNAADRRAHASASASGSVL